MAGPLWKSSPKSEALFVANSHLQSLEIIVLHPDYLSLTNLMLTLSAGPRPIPNFRKYRADFRLMAEWLAKDLAVRESKTPWMMWSKQDFMQPFEPGKGCYGMGGRESEGKASAYMTSDGCKISYNEPGYISAVKGLHRDEYYRADLPYSFRY